MSDYFNNIKDPDAILPYGLNWTDWIISGDSVTEASWTITSPSGDADPIVVDSSSVAANVTTAILSGGTAGNSYSLTCHITTANSYEEDRTIFIQCQQR